MEKFKYLTMSKYLLCDLEATGNREQDRIIQLGLMVLEGSIDSMPIHMFNALNATDAHMMSEAMELHNITPEMLKDKKSLYNTEGYQILCELNQAENIFIAHDAPSDLKMLQKEKFIHKTTIIDTLRCAKHLFPELDTHRLQFLRYELGLYKEENVEAERVNIQLKSHDALSDVLVTKLLLKKLIIEVQNKFAITSESVAVKKLIELSSTPVLLQRFKFGKYKGEYIEEIANSDYGYMVWMRDTLKLDEDMKYTLDYYL